MSRYGLRRRAAPILAFLIAAAWRAAAAAPVSYLVSRVPYLVSPLSAAERIADEPRDTKDEPRDPSHEPRNTRYATRDTSHEIRTTDAGIALGNLDAQIDGLQAGLGSGHAGGRRAGELVELLVARAQILASIADYERANRLAEQFVREHPHDAEAYLARAQARAALHRFPDALADLDEATRRGGPQTRIRSARAAVWQATGRYDDALAIRRQAAEAAPDTLTLGAEACLLAERGDIESAERLFAAAQHAYRDTSPFPLSWLYFQQGMMWMRAGDLARARELLEAAHRRLPQDTTVADHLGWLSATLGDRDRALALLRTAAAADDPAAAADLAQVLRLAGEQEESERWRARAAARYEDLLQRHPEAFLNHAALFWLGAGADPSRALALARRQAEIQSTPISFALLLQAALAANQPAVACEAAAAVLAFGPPTPYDGPLGDRSVAARVAQSCARPAGATPSPGAAATE